MTTCVVVSASSDIGFELCRDWRTSGFRVLGTFRDLKRGESLAELGVETHQCDLSDGGSRKLAIDSISKGVESHGWDVLILAAGTQVPVGKFQENDFGQWRESIEVNFTSQVEFVHELLPAANKGASIIFFAGGGTNGPVDRYSAYTIAKIASIKLCELLASEEPNYKFSILGPGWVGTKIHKQTLDAGALAGDNFEKTLNKLSGTDLVPIEQVVRRVNWIIESEARVVSGRNFSVVSDPFDSEDFRSTLLANHELLKLRRLGNNLF
jgi:NAD(P)-dependent dehydrogenase (short-subunit alcohol dehydrogenase family)